MQCQNCGHDRPRQGKCPHCGAQPGAPNAQGGGFSSMRDWRNEPSRGTPSRPLNPSDRSYGGRSAPDSSASRRSSGTNWGAPDQSYPRRDDPNQSYPRRGDPNQSYPRRGWDDGGDRALVPTPATGDLMVRDERMLPTLPTEEEERALGIRRPAFIPATEERRGKRPGRWRVISGAASVMLLCVGISVISGFMLQRNVFPGLSKLLGFSKPGVTNVKKQEIPSVYLTPRPLLTPGTAQTPISSVITTTAVTQQPNKPYTPAAPITALFVVGENVNVLCNVNQNAKNGDVVSIQWIFNQVNITPDLQANNPGNVSKTIENAKSGYEVLFVLKQVPQPGFGQALIYYNGVLAYTVLFAVEVAPSTPTPVPPTTTPSPVASPISTAKPGPTATTKP